MKVVNVNGFLAEICQCCFVCGDKKYCEFYVNGHLYRVCASCLKTENVKKFFSTIGEEGN